jgi:hypothetical protein
LWVKDTILFLINIDLKMNYKLTIVPIFFSIKKKFYTFK